MVKCATLGTSFFSTLGRSPVPASPKHRNSAEFRIRLYSTSSALDQDEESFEFEHRGKTRRLRIHDYADLYRIPGLYEALVYDKLECNSPTRIAELIDSVLIDWPHDPSDLRVLDLGAGNGIMAEKLRRIGVGHIIGLDLLPEAAMAAQRDRPNVYDDFVVADLTALPDNDRERLEEARLDCLVTVAALGFGDIPPEAFATAFNLISTQGWLAMTIKEGFLDPNVDDSGFARLVRQLIDEGIIEIQAHQRYCHRISIDGEQLFYLAVIARKMADIPNGGITQNHNRNGVVTTVRGTDPASLILSKS